MQRENTNGLLSNDDYTKQEFSSSNEISPLSDDCLKNQKIMNSLNDDSHENTSSKNDENKNLNDNVNGDMRKNYANENVIQKKYIDSNNFVVNEDKNSNNFVVNEHNDSNNFVVNEDKDSKHFVVDKDKDSNNFVVNEDKDSNNFVVNEDKDLNNFAVNEDKKKNDLNEYDSQNEIPEQAKLKRQIFIILICVNMIAFLGSFSYWMQSGVLPYLTRKIGVNPQVFGYMQSTFALYQLVGSPLFGRFGDVFGCRICLVVSEIASAVAFGSLAFATNVAMLFLSRVPAIFMHNLQGSYMIITDCTLPSERANYLGKLGVSHGIGMIVGSFTGGLITEYFGDSATAIFAACGNLLCAIIVCIFIPDDTKAIRRKLENITSTAPAQSVGASLGLKELLNIFKIKIIRYLLFIKILSAFPFALLYSMFSMAIMDFYKQGPRVNGIILAYLGSLSILIQGILIGLLTSRFLDPTLVKLAVFLNTGAFMFLIVADNIYLLCVTLLPMAIGGTVSHIVITAAITKVVPIEDTGSALGLTLSFHALIRSIAPTFGGFIFTIAGWPFIGVIGYSIHLFLSVFVVLLGKDSFDSK